MLMQPTSDPLTVDDYHRLGELGVFGEDDRVELIHGQVVAMTPIGAAHASCVKRLLAAFVPLANGRATLSVQDPLFLATQEEPQPDIAILRYRHDGYRRAHPAPADALLVIEVADTSLTHDRSEKLPLYATAGIAEVWLVDLPADRIEVLRRAVDGHYRDIQVARRGETVAPLAFPDLVLSVSDILG